MTQWWRPKFSCFIIWCHMRQRGAILCLPCRIRCKMLIIKQIIPNRIWPTWTLYLILVIFQRKYSISYRLITCWPGLKSRIFLLFIRRCWGWLLICLRNCVRWSTAYTSRDSLKIPNGWIWIFCWNNCRIWRLLCAPMILIEIGPTCLNEHGSKLIQFMEESKWNQNFYIVFLWNLIIIKLIT